MNAQHSLKQQLQKLICIANQEGLYEAAYWLKTALSLPNRVFDDSDWNAFHDVVVDILKPDSLGGSELDRNTLKKVYDILPEHIKAIATQWGMGDTVFRNAAYEYLEKIKNS